MATAGQYSSGYSAVPPTAVEQGNSSADITDENRYASQQQEAAAAWGYQQSHAVDAVNQTAQHAAQGQWQYQGAYGGYGSTYPAGYPHHEGYDQYAQAAAAASANQTAQWNYQHYQNYQNQTQANGVAVPQAAYYGQEGWAFYENGTPYWNSDGVGQPTKAIPAEADMGQYTMHQQYQAPNQMYGQEEIYQSPASAPITQSTPSTIKPYGHPDGWQHRTALMEPVITEPHPRQNLSVWKWRIMLIASNILSLING